MTNRDIKKEVDEGRLREDLYYRLNQFSIHIPLLANHFLKLYSDKSGRKIDGFAPGLFEIFQRYPWSGNIRELEEVIKVAVASAVYENSQVIQAYHFPPHITYPNPFNPETWIPYHLKDESNVTIKIYSNNGKLVRMLELGRKEAGIYVSPPKAAYWDGNTILILSLCII